MELLNKIPKKNNEKLAWRVIDGEAVVIPLENQSEEGEKLDIFNETATKIWELIDGKNTIKDIIKKIIDEYDIKPDEAQSQIKKLISEMSAKKVIII